MALFGLIKKKRKLPAGFKKFKKGSPEAKAHMAKIRGMRKKKR